MATARNRPHMNRTKPPHPSPLLHRMEEREKLYGRSDPRRRSSDSLCPGLFSFRPVRGSLSHLLFLPRQRFDRIDQLFPADLAVADDSFFIENE